MGQSHEPDMPVTAANLLEILFDEMPMGIVVFDCERRVRRANPTWCEFIDRYTPSSAEQVQPGVSLYELAPGTEARFEPIVERVLAGETVRLEAFEAVSGGITSYWDVVFSPLRENGQITGFVDVVTDATERVLRRRHLERRIAERTQEIEQRRRVAASLRDILALLNSSCPLPEVLEFIMSEACEILSADAAAVYQFDVGNRLIRVHASAGMPPSFAAIHQLSLIESEANLATLRRQPYISRHLRRRLAALLSQDLELEEMARRWIAVMHTNFDAYLSVPLIVAGQLYGAMSLYYRVCPDIDDETIAQATAFGDQTALAIENARLYEQVREMAASEERSRLARDLHDAVSQTLFSASLIAEALPTLWRTDETEGLRRLEELRQLTRGAQAEMRTLLLELRPQALLNTDLNVLFRQLAEALRSRGGLNVNLSLEPVCELEDEKKVALYRIAQEALNNIHKHAQAENAAITLRCQDHHLTLTVSDDGNGFESGAISGNHLGLQVMAERAASVNGKLIVDTQPDQGTAIRLTIPLEETHD